MLYWNKPIVIKYHEGHKVQWVSWKEKQAGGGKEVTRKAFLKEVAVAIGAEGCVGFPPTALTAGAKN